MPAKRKFDDIRNLILKSLCDGQKTVNQISSDAGINWKTVDNHLVFLVGKGMVHIVFSSPYAKIYELTDTGHEFVDKVGG